MKTGTPVDVAKLLEGIPEEQLKKLLRNCSPYVPEGWKPLPLQRAFAVLPHIEVLFGGPLAMGTPTLTPIGFRPIGELQVGDEVFTHRGKKTRITEIPFEGMEESYRIKFSDGTSIVASKGHKWLVGTSDWRKTKKEYRVRRTKDLLDYKLSRNRNKYYVPQTKPVEFDFREVPLDPYFIGAMLGDGCFTTRARMTLTGKDPEIVEQFQLPEGYSAKPLKGTIQWKFTQGQYGRKRTPEEYESVIWNAVVSLGLAGTRSHTKFIPEEYLFNDVDTRLSVLQGLMDTDGTVREGTSGELVYTTVSDQLRDDVVFLAQSLGFLVRVTEESQDPYGPCYRIRLSESLLCPFRLSRKIDRWKQSKQRGTGRKHITKITPIGKKKVRCITVEDPDHTFLVRNFTVTKNSAGGSKSEALLYAANYYTHIPGYKAIIYRRTFQDLIRPGALLNRALDWYAPWLGREIKYVPSQHAFYFPSGAQLVFGHMGRAGAQDTMQGAEYHFVGIDEVTQHSETDALYALSRLRRRSHEDIPLRARFTANPGGKGHRFIMKRFGLVPNKHFDENNPRSPMYVGSDPNKLFIPSRLADNPYIDQESYVRQLESLDPITRDRLLKGDWSASPFSRFKQEWFKRYHIRGPYYNSALGVPIHAHQFMKFATIDVAASFAEGVGGRQFVTTASDFTDIASAEPCWTVITVFGVIYNSLFILDVFRVQTEIPEVTALMQTVRHKWGPIPFGVEKNGVGTGLAQLARQLGFQVEEIWTQKDKIINSYSAANMAQQGNIYIPDRQENGRPIQGHEWLDDWEGEVFTWMGLKDETSDQVDSLSSGCNRVAHLCLNRLDAPGAIPEQPLPNVGGRIDFSGGMPMTEEQFFRDPFSY